jgi:DNA repair protein SbcC/Rad50
MKIKSIHLKNIRSYEDERIEFPSGTTLLSGDIGCGKSTILQSIEFALFGLKKGELEGTDLLRHGKNSGQVNLNFELDGHDIFVERFLRRGKNITQDACRIVIDNKPEDTTPVELKSKILEMIGYSQSMLKKSKPLFRFTVYTPQEEMKKILADEEDRLETLRSIFDIDRYGIIRNNAKTFLTELRRMKTGLEGEIRGMDADSSRITELETNKNTIIIQLAEKRGALDQARNDETRKKSELDVLRKDFTEVNLIRHQLVRKESDLLSKQKMVERTKTDIEDTKEKISNYQKMLNEVSQAGGVQELRKYLVERELSRDTLLTRRAIMNDEARKLQKIYSEGVCGMCGQKVHNPEEFSSHINEIKRSMEEMTINLSDIDSACVVLKTQITAAEKAEQYRLLIGELGEKNARLEKEILTTEKDMTIISNEIDLLKPRTVGFDSLQDRINNTESEFYSLQRKRSEIETAIARHDQQITDLNRRIDEIREKLSQIEVLREKTTRITSLINWFDPFISLTETMEKHVMLAIQREFDQYFQKWFSILMGDQLSVKIDERFSPIIEQNTYSTDYENLSGGEKTSVALAYRLALNKVINDMTDNIKTKELLILDEPTDGFSTDQLDRLRDVIAELNLGQIIIVSHETKIDTYVDNVIRIYKENHISRVVNN